MTKYFSKFTTAEDYQSSRSSLILPHVSLIGNTMQVHYNPWVETRVVAKFNVTSTSSATKIAGSTSGFSAIEIDGVELQSVVSEYTFDTLGEHTVKYTLVNPTSIGESAFNLCICLTSVVIPNSVTSIGDKALRRCDHLTDIVIPSGVTSIGEGAFQCTGLTDIVIPSGVTSIGEGAFYECGHLTDIVIPSGVTSIGRALFGDCLSLTSVVIPSGVTSIGEGAFYRCTSLASITCDATTAPTIASDTFQDIGTGGTLHIPSGGTGYDVWMGTGDYYLGSYSWSMAEPVVWTGN